MTPSKQAVAAVRHLFVDHAQIVQLECLRRSIWGTKSLWRRVVTDPGEQP